MRVPLSWLSEYVDIVPGSTPQDVQAALVKVGFEEEALHDFDLTGPIVVGEVLEFTPEPQSNGKTIRWCQVRVAPAGQNAADGEGDVRGIVCGAGNFFVGDKVVVTLPGAVLPGGFAIAARKTYGHTSDGMIASARELGLGEDHDGILRLSTLGLNPEVGTDALALLGLNDTAVEVNVTPDRGYAFSIRGIAREYSHSTGQPFRDPAAGTALQQFAAPLSHPDSVAPTFPVRINDQAPIRGKSGAETFVTRVVRGVDAERPSPAWLVARLKLAGIRSISLIVDITNYVMLELGQPIHGYDLDTLRGGITVRRAHLGETLKTLDGQIRTLNTEDLLITDDSGPIGLAGVMGGATTEIGAGTTNVLVEAAVFEPVSIARSARRHKLPSEASKRFERGVDPRVSEAAAARVVQLLVQLAGGHADPLGSVYQKAADPAPIRLPEGFVSALVGVKYTVQELTHALTEIGADVAFDDAGFIVTPPSWRPDLTTKADLAEEVARIVGYDRIPSVVPIAPPGTGFTRSQKLRRATADGLAFAGLTEVLSYPFVSQPVNDQFSPEGAPAVKLANPLDNEAPFLRRNLLPGLLETAKRNYGRGLTDLAIFELGSVFRPEPGVEYGSAYVPPLGKRPEVSVLAKLNAGIPPQPRHVAVAFTGDLVEKQPGQPSVAAGWQTALDTVQQIAAALSVDIQVVQGSHRGFHPGRTARLVVRRAHDRITVGFAGELDPALAKQYDLPRVVAIAELDLDLLIELADDLVVAAPVRTMPAATQDLSLVVDQRVPAGDLLNTIVEGAGELLESARLVDDYRGFGLPEGSKSLTFALRFRAEDRTLTQAEASEARNKAVELAATRFQAALRE